MKEIAADRVAPAHVSPRISKRVVLKKQMVFAVVEDQSIGIVRPIALRRKVNLRPIRLIIISLLRAGEDEAANTEAIML